jgi:hypothetical protein
MTWRSLYGHWLLMRARRAELKAMRFKARAEKVFRGIKGRKE